MSIVLFKDVTTEDALLALEAEGEKYKGIYVDMSDAPQRKYAKDKADAISKLIKDLDRARIDKSKVFKASVEKEAAAIKQRLEDANRPWTLLIDGWNNDRAKILAEEKRVREAKELAVQIENDHEFALLIDSKVMAEKAEKERLQLEHEENLKADAAAKAKEEIEADLERQKQLHIRNEKERLANTEHLKTVNNAIVDKLVALGVDFEIAKAVVRCMAKSEIPRVKINY